MKASEFVVRLHTENELTDAEKEWVQERIKDLLSDEFLDIQHSFTGKNHKRIVFGLLAVERIILTPNATE